MSPISNFLCVFCCVITICRFACKLVVNQTQVQAHRRRGISAQCLWTAKGRFEQRHEQQQQQQQQQQWWWWWWWRCKKPFSIRLEGPGRQEERDEGHAGLFCEETALCNRRHKPGSLVLAGACRSTNPNLNSNCNSNPKPNLEFFLNSP